MGFRFGQADLSSDCGTAGAKHCFRTVLSREIKYRR